MIKINFNFRISFAKSDKAGKEQETKKLTDFFELAEQEVATRTAALSRSTVENYRTALRSLRCFLGRDITTAELSGELLKEYERWLRQRDVSPNTVSCYMRSLRSLSAHLCSEEAKDSFSQVFTGRCKTDKRAITEAEISRLRKLQLPRGTFLYLVRDLFLFSFYSLGMPFVDMAFLRKKQIGEGQIVYHRHKTGQRIVITIEPCMQEIINRYEDSERDYVFPLLSTDNPQKAYDEYLLKLNRYNRALKQIAFRAGISRRLTSYVSRHSWASVAFSNNVDLPVISKALGHANPQNTLTYIKEINDDRLSKANREILKSLKND